MIRSAIIAGVLLVLDGCCTCPPPVIGSGCPAPGKEARPQVRLPGRLGPPGLAAPASLEALLEEHRLRHVPFGVFRDAFRPYVGARVRWRLRSWGGEHRIGGYDTPSGKQPERTVGGEVGRIRFVAPSFSAADDLISVDREGQPVVTCLALFPRDDDPRFIRSDDKRQLTPERGVFTVEATLWGALREGGNANIWLHDCALLPD